MIEATADEQAIVMAHAMVLTLRFRSRMFIVFGLSPGGEGKGW